MRYFTGTQLLLLAAALAYILVPFDVLPELLLGPLGLVDDAAAFALAAGVLSRARAAAAAPVIDGQTVPPRD